MKTFSRWMSAAPAHQTPVWAWPILTLFLVALLVLIYQHPYFLGAIAVFIWGSSVLHTRCMRRVAASRADESICTFVRSFDRRQTDSWVLRAVYEELSRYSAVDGRPLPIRPDDRWKEDLKIDPDDFGDLAVDIAHRAGRSLEDMESNPFYDKLKTVRDLVGFFEHQPKLQEVEQSSSGTKAGSPHRPLER